MSGSPSIVCSANLGASLSVLSCILACVDGLVDALLPGPGAGAVCLPFYGNDASGVALQFARAPCRSPECRCRACMPHRDTAELPHGVCCRLRLGRQIPRRCRQPLLHKPHRQPSKPLGVEVRRFWRGVVASGCGELCRVGVQQRSMICAP